MKNATLKTILLAMTFQPCMWTQTKYAGDWPEIPPAAQGPTSSSLEMDLCNRGFAQKLYGMAFPHCLQAYNQGGTEAGAKLGAMYYSGQGVQRNYAQAARFLAPVYHRDAELAYELANIYYYAWGGGQRDVCRARPIYVEAARKGHAVANSQLGYIDELGECGPRNRPRAIAEFDTATRLGDRYTAATARVLRMSNTPVFHTPRELNNYVGRFYNDDPCESPNATPAFKLAICGIAGVPRSGPVFSCGDNGMSIGRPCAGR